MQALITAAEVVLNTQVGRWIEIGSEFGRIAELAPSHHACVGTNMINESSTSVRGRSQKMVRI